VEFNKPSTERSEVDSVFGWCPSLLVRNDLVLVFQSSVMELDDSEITMKVWYELGFS
jgi:hypothetical protein